MNNENNETVATLADITNASLDSTIIHLNLAVQQVIQKPIAKLHINNAILSLEQWRNLIIEQNNSDIEEFNQLVDDIDRLQAILTSKNLENNLLSEENKEVKSLKASIGKLTQKLAFEESETQKKNEEIAQKAAEIEQKTAKLEEKEQNLCVLTKELLSGEDEIKKLKNRLEQTKAESTKTEKLHKADQAELKKLRALQPEKTRARLAEQKRKNLDKQKTIDTLKHSLAASKKEMERFEKLDQDSKLLAREVLRLRERLSFVDGDVHVKAYQGLSGDEKIVFFIYIFSYGIAHEPADKTIKLLETPFHFEVKCTTGTNFTVSFTPFVQPYHSPITELSGEIPDLLLLELHELGMERIKKLYPAIYDRVLWAKAQEITKFNIEPKMLKALMKAGFNTLYSVVKFPISHFYEALKLRHKNLSGIDDDDIVRLFNVLHAACDEWLTEREIALRNQVA